MLQPARFEQEFVIAGDRRIARLDVEGIGLVGGLNAGIGIPEPVSRGPRQIGFTAEEPQSADEQRLRFGEDRSADRRRHLDVVDGRTGFEDRRRHRRGPTLQPPPPRLQSLVTES